MAQGVSTRHTLLEELKDVGNQDAWERFSTLYSPMILAFAAKRGCSEQVGAEVLQDTLICLMAQLPDFSYDPERGRFRSYLFGVVKHRVSRARQRERRHRERFCSMAESSEDSGEPTPEPVEPTEVPTACIEWDELWYRNVALIALDQVQNRVSPLTFRSFEMNVLQGLPIAEISRELGLSANQIYQHKDRIVKMLHRDYRSLLEEMGEQ